MKRYKTTKCKNLIFIPDLNSSLQPLYHQKQYQILVEHLGVMAINILSATIEWGHGTEFEYET